MSPATRVRPMRCRQVARVLQRYLDGQVDADTAARVMAHLDDCAVCEEEAATFRSIIAALRRRGRTDDGLTERIRAFAEQLARET